MAGRIITGGATTLINSVIAAKTGDVIPVTCATCPASPGMISEVAQKAPTEKATNPVVAIEIKNAARVYQFGRAHANPTNIVTIEPTAVHIPSMVNPLPNASSRKFDSKGFGLTTSMHRHARLNPTHCLPDDYGIHARDVFIGRCFKRLIGQAHGLIEKLLVVHGQIVGLLRGAEHSYFPMGFDNSIVRNAAFRRIPFILNAAE